MFVVASIQVLTHVVPAKSFIRNVAYKAAWGVTRSMWGKLHVGNEARGIPTMDGGEVSCFVEFSSASSALNFVVTINR